MSKDALQKVLFAFSAVVLGLAACFWTRQVLDVVELLRLAYG